MSLYRYEGKEPRIGENCYVSDSARVIGAVTIGDGCYIGHGAINRGDYGVIKIGKGTAVEEGVVIHARFEKTAVIGDHVTLGHAAVMHGERLEDYAVVGMKISQLFYYELY